MSNIVEHLAIIMDGNGRWASKRGMARTKGHEKGAETVRTVMQYCAKHPTIKDLTLYAFSTENWKRPKAEIEFLMKLMARYLKNELATYLDNGVRFEVIGDISRFSKSLQKTIRETEEKTKHCTHLTHHLALNYGAKDEIVRAVNRLIDANMQVSEASLNAHLDCSTDVDLLIRTGGDHRLSNFLLWQAAYAELFFTETLWPDFSESELDRILEQFTQIDRRFGGLNT